MKKITTTLLTAVLLVSLTGCSNVPSESDSTPSNTSSGVSTESDSTPSDTSSEISEPVSDATDSGNSSYDGPVGSEITAQFELPNGDPVDLTNAVVNHGLSDIALSEITNDNWASVTCDGVYLAEAVGVYYDNIVNADIFDENEMKFMGAPETVVHKYKKYNVGDMFGDLKLTEASTNFSPYASDFKPRYFNGGFVRFEGTLTLTGKCRLALGDIAYTSPRDIEFLPDAKSAKLLPIIRYSIDDEGNEDLMRGVLGDFCYLAENYDLLLGNADDHPELDFSGFPTDGSCVDVQVTVENIFLSSNIERHMCSFGCDLVDLEIIQ